MTVESRHRLYETLSLCNRRATSSLLLSSSSSSSSSSSAASSSPLSSSTANGHHHHHHHRRRRRRLISAPSSNGTTTTTTTTTRTPTPTPTTPTNGKQQSATAHTRILKSTFNDHRTSLRRSPTASASSNIIIISSGANTTTPTNERRKCKKRYNNNNNNNNNNNDDRNIITLNTTTATTTLREETQSAESPPLVESRSSNRFIDSPHESLTHSELDDYIIDEILSLEDDQMALRDVGGTKTQPLPLSYSCADNLTTLSSPHHASSASNGRPIPGATNSGHSGSPIGAIPITSSTYRQIVSSSAPTSSMDMETLVRGSSQEMNSNEPDFYRDRRKKDIHNMIERRRRYNINDRIKELGLMLPKHSAEEMKLNKGTILKASCDYIRQLQKDRELMLRQQQQQAFLEQTTRIYAERVKELEEQLQKNGLAIPPASTTLPPVPPAPLPNSGRPIKQEPFDDMPSSPSQTPTGSLSSAGFLSQLSDTTAAMVITSPIGVQGQQATSQPDNPNSFFNVGSCSPSDNNNSPYATPNWRRSNLSSSSSSTLTQHHHQQQQQQPFSDLLMEDLSSLHTSGPLLQGDPMISAAGGGPSPHSSSTLPSQMSPDIQWDQANFSPDNQTSTTTHTTNSVGIYQQHSGMDFS